MRLTILLSIITLVSASWFGSETQPSWKQWDQESLQSWLKAQNVDVPKDSSYTQLRDLVQSHWDKGTTWTSEQYQNSQKYFHDVKDDAFTTWDESRLRQFLLEQGIIAPASTKEELQLLARKQYRSYRDAAVSLGAQASAAASTAVYGDSRYQASQTLSSLAARATEPVVRAVDDSKDYVYSTWSDNQLRTWLEDRGLIKTKQQASRDQLLAKMKVSYAAVANPVWEAWSTSYIHDWLVAHKILKPESEKRREALIKQMQTYFYLPSDTVYSAWSDSDMRQWLIDRNIIKSDAQIKREHLQKLVADNYQSAVDTIWSSWRDSEIRGWLIDKGYRRSDAQVKRDELVKLMNEKYNDASAKTAEYLTWPDARLRAWLRLHDVPESELPGTRNDLLHEVRIRYNMNQSRVEHLMSKIRSVIGSSVETAEEKLGNILGLLTGTGDKVDSVKQDAENKWTDAEKSLSDEATKATRGIKEEL